MRMEAKEKKVNSFLIEKADLLKNKKKLITPKPSCFLKPPPTDQKGAVSISDINGTKTQIQNQPIPNNKNLSSEATNPMTNMRLSFSPLDVKTPHSKVINSLQTPPETIHLPGITNIRNKSTVTWRLLSSGS